MLQIILSQNYSSITTPSPMCLPSLRAVRRGFRACLERARQRKALAELDQRLLADIAVTEMQARAECAKAVWRP